MDPTPSRIPFEHTMTWIPPLPSTGTTQPLQTNQGQLYVPSPMSTVVSSHHSSKRSRISRACDTCRKKKIRCDVDNCQPCTTCKQYEWECTFNDTARKRGPPKGYIEGLEARLERMEKLLSKVQGDNNSDNDTPIYAATAPQTPLPNPYHSAELSMRTSTLTKSPINVSSCSSSYAKPTSLNNELSGDSYLPPKGKVVRYLGSSSGLYMLNDILKENEQENINNDNGSNNNNNSDSAVLKGVHQVDNRISQSSGNGSSWSSPGIVSSNQPEEEPNNNNFTSVETRQGTYQLRRMNVYDNDLVLVRDQTEDETKTQVAAVYEQENMESIIPRHILSSLINIYFDADCMTLPILDREDFLNSFQGKTAPPPPPILTYAICSYACFLVPSDHSIFMQSGLSRNQIFHAVVDRASMFIRSEHLTPHIQTIQALVLLCAHPTYSTGSYRNWILTGMAVRMAQDLGLHRLVTHTEITEEIAEKRRRLWYSVYLTDRWCCSVMGRPLAIADSDCDVELPSVDAVNEPGKYIIFVNLVKLSGILGEVLRRVYSPKAKSMGYATHIMEQTVWSLDQMLKEWLDNVPPDYFITQDQLRQMKGMENAHSNVFRSGGPMTVCYYAVVVLLFRPFIVFECGKHHSSKLFNDAPKRCMESAKNAIDVARHIPEREMARYGWNFAAYSVIQAALIHVYNCTNDDPVIAQTSREYVRTSIDECVAPMTRDMPYGPPAVQFLENILRLMKVNTSPSSIDQKSSGTNDFPSADHSRIPTINTQITNLQSPNTTLCNRPTPSLLPHTIPTSPTHMLPFTNDRSSPATFRNNDTNNNQPTLPGDQNETYASNPVDILNMILNGDSQLDDRSNPILTQATWQYLFTSAGTPFTGNASNTLDSQVPWENMFMDNLGDSNTG